MLLLSGLRNHMESDPKVVRINEVQALRSFRERAACLQREVTKCTMGRWHQGLILTRAELLGAVTWPHLVLELERRGLATGLAGRGSSTMSPLWPRMCLLLWVLQHPAWSWPRPWVAMEQGCGGPQRGRTTSRTTGGGLVGGEDLLPPPYSLQAAWPC